MAEKRLTTYMDPPEAYKRTPCRVVVKLHQAVELPAGNDQGLANPFVAVRFGGKAVTSQTKVGTTNPVFDELLVFDSSYDKETPSPLFINIYHQETFGRVFLARTEIAVNELVRTPSKCVPQRLFLTGGSTDKSSTKSFLLASVMMFDNITSPPPPLPLNDIKSFHFHIQGIGLRQLAPAGYSQIKNPFMRVFCPSYNIKESLVETIVEERVAVGPSVDFVGKKLADIVLKDVQLPIAYLSSFYVTIQVPALHWSRRRDEFSPMHTA